MRCESCGKKISKKEEYYIGYAYRGISAAGASITVIIPLLMVSGNGSAKHDCAKNLRFSLS